MTASILSLRTPSLPLAFPFLSFLSFFFPTFLYFPPLHSLPMATQTTLQELPFYDAFPRHDELECGLTSHKLINVHKIGPTRGYLRVCAGCGWAEYAVSSLISKRNYDPRLCDRGADSGIIVPHRVDEQSMMEKEFDNATFTARLAR